MNLAPWLADTWNEFHSRMQQERLAHALMIKGPEGTGKSSLGKAICERLLCQSDGEYACGECRSCTLRKGGAHPDFFCLEPPEGKHQITVDQVREVIAQLTLTSSFSPRKVALISPAEAMNTNAANALLKSLEEPPGDTVLVLVSHNPSALPVTINSRCQSLTVSSPEQEPAVQWLVQEGGMTVEEALMALEAGGRSPLIALGMHADGLVETHAGLRDQLMAALGSPGQASQLAASYSDLDPDQLWTWLSRISAELIRGALTGQGRLADTRAVAKLQARADRFRLMSRSAVRQDLLLRDWLIEWSRLRSG